MGEQVKYIVTELQKPPFSKHYNLITLDALTGEQLLQVLNDVISEIEPKHKLDIREEQSEQTTIRLLGALRILKYKPPEQLSAQFRQGLLQGEKHVVYPILEWILRRIPELKKRAYLAKYLVKLDIPPEVSADMDVSEVYQQYEQLITEFTLVHKESEDIKNSGYSTAELRKDIEEMEKEKEIVEQRIERMHRKVEGMPNMEIMLEVARRLRMQKEKEKELQNQRIEQRTSINHSKQRIHRLELQLNDLRQAGVGATPEGLLQKLEEETKVNVYIVTEKLPQEIETRRAAVDSLQRVLNQPALGADDIANLESRIREMNKEIKEMSDDKNVSNDPMEDKLTLFRQQAAIIRRKKETMAEKLTDVRTNLANIEEEIQEKRSQVESFAGETILRGEEFKRYVNSLREKSNIYKQRRTELSDLKAEYGVLERTTEILKSREEGLLQHLAVQESEQGVAGVRETRQNLENVATEKASLDEKKGETLEDMSRMVHQLTLKISERKARLAPIIKELRPLRQQNQDLQMDYDEKKSAYDSTALQLQTNMAKVEIEVKKMREEIQTAETRFHVFETQSKYLEGWQDTVALEMKLYVSNKPEDRKRCVRERFLKIISDGEKRSKALKDEQRAVREAVTDNTNQTRMWGDLEKLFICKKECAERGPGGNSGTVLIAPGTETLVL